MTAPPQASRPPRNGAPRPPRFELARFTREGFARLGRTFHSLGHFRDLTRFFAVFFVYSCGLMTVITMAGIYAEETLGFTASDLVIMFLVLQLASVVGALASAPSRMSTQRYVNHGDFCCLLFAAI